MIPIAKPIIGQEEIDLVVEVLKSNLLVQGKLVEEFENRLAGVVGAKHVVAVSSGTAALHIALLAHGIGPGDEVITTPFSFIATANAILYAGAKPVFVDICEDTYNIDPQLIEAKVTPRTKAILPVHLYGCPADMSAIGKIAKQHNLAVIEDAAQAIGASIGSDRVGTFGTACFSFYATKNIATGEGGAVTTDDDEIAERLRLLRNHGQRARYDHTILGYNYRLTELQAAVGLVQLNRLEEFTQRRIANAEYFNRLLPKHLTPKTPSGYRHVFHQYTVRIPNSRDKAAQLFNQAGVGTSIHYPIPIHRQKLYLDLGFEESIPKAEKASMEVLSLPIHPSLSDKELSFIAEAATRCLPSS